MTTRRPLKVPTKHDTEANCNDAGLRDLLMQRMLPQAPLDGRDPV